MSGKTVGRVWMVWEESSLYGHVVRSWWACRRRSAYSFGRANGALAKIDEGTTISQRRPKSGSVPETVDSHRAVVGRHAHHVAPRAGGGTEDSKMAACSHNPRRLHAGIGIHRKQHRRGLVTKPKRGSNLPVGGRPRERRHLPVGEVGAEKCARAGVPKAYVPVLGASARGHECVGPRAVTNSLDRGSVRKNKLEFWLQTGANVPHGAAVVVASHGDLGAAGIDGDSYCC